MDIMELRIENVPDDVVRAVKMEALAQGTTLRALAIAALERIAAGEVETEEPAPEVQKQSATAPPWARSVGTATPKASNQATQAARRQQDDPGEITRCRHGMTFHPGCNA